MWQKGRIREKKRNIGMKNGRKESKKDRKENRKEKNE